MLVTVVSLLFALEYSGVDIERGEAGYPFPLQLGEQIATLALNDCAQ